MMRGTVEFYSQIIGDIFTLNKYASFKLVSQELLSSDPRAVISFLCCNGYVIWALSVSILLSVIPEWDCGTYWPQRGKITSILM